MYLRDFQMVMRRHDFGLYGRARGIWGPIELRILRKIPKRFDFGGVKKIVIEVGPEPQGKPYQELLGVGLWRYPEFDMQAFLCASHPEQISVITSVIRSSFTDLSGRFDTPAPWLFDELDRIDAGA
jgi:hypothetical protein